MSPKSNYFLVSRELLSSDRWLDESFSRGQAWVDLFGLANHRPGFVRVRGVRVEVDRGQLAWSQITLANRWKWSRGKVKRYLNELEKHKDIVQQNNKLISLITICKYDTWQGGYTKDSTTNGTTNGQQTDNKRYTNNKNKELRIKNNINIRPTAVDQSKPDINEMFEQWNEVVGYEIASNKQKNRYACSNLLKKHGKDKLAQLLKGVAMAQSDKYAPRISDFVSLQSKLSELLAWGKRQSSTKVKGIIKV